MADGAARLTRHDTWRGKPMRHSQRRGKPAAPSPMAWLDLGAICSRGLPSSASVCHNNCSVSLSQSGDCFQVLVENISLYMENHHHIIDMTT
jgi:hypothetical protein